MGHVLGKRASFLELFGFTFSLRLMCIPKPNIILGFYVFGSYGPIAASLQHQIPNSLNQVYCFFIFKLAFLFLCLQWSCFCLLVAYTFGKKTNPLSYLRAYAWLDICHIFQFFSLMMSVYLCPLSSLYMQCLSHPN